MSRDRLKGRPRQRLRILAAAFLTAGVAVLALLSYSFAEARRDPVVRRADLALPRWPTGARPVTIALLSDLHLGNRSTNTIRLSRVVSQVNDLHPDLVLIAGDFIAGHKPQAEDSVVALLQPLAQLRAPLGVVGVLGNHDYWTGASAIRSALTHLGVAVLVNGVIQLGPIALGGVDDGFTRHDAVEAVASQLRALPGGRIILTHSPEIVSKIPDDISLLLAGHTHCGQMRLPWIGSIDLTLRYGRYECGLVRDGGRVTIITAGVGTSIAPLRLGAPPDFWLLTVGPAGARSGAIDASPKPKATSAPGVGWASSCPERSVGFPPSMAARSSQPTAGRSGVCHRPDAA